jgi:hypothetical protein
VAVVKMNQHAESVLHWIIAAVIAGAIAWTFVVFHMRESEANCAQNPCHLDYERRLAAIESAMVARTQDRYTGSDAKRDLLIINQRIDALQRLHQEQHK